MSCIYHRIYRLMEESRERELSTLRQRLFESHWSATDYKAMLRDEEPSEVYTDDSGFRILVGNCEHACDLFLLEREGVEYVLNVAAGDPSCQMTQEVYGERVKCKKIAAGDMPGYNIRQHFEEVYEFLEEVRAEGTTVLVHCIAGASRSPTVVMAYLMQRCNWTLEEAAQQLCKHRKRVFPNLGFMNQLVQLDRTIHHRKNSF